MLLWTTKRSCSGPAGATSSRAWFSSRIACHGSLMRSKHAASPVSVMARWAGSLEFSANTLAS